MAKGIDSDVDCTATAQLIKGAGYDFVGRYYRMPSPYSGKTPLKRSEAAALTTQGLSIVSIWEYISGSRNRIETLTYETGKDEGKRAYSQALAVPQTAGTPIYFCVDEGYDPDEPSYAGPIEAYFKGVNEAFAEAAGQGQEPAYKIGVYGPGAVCKWLQLKGLDPISKLLSGVVRL